MRILLAILTVLWLTGLAEAQGLKQYGQCVCTGASTGSPPTSAVVQRAPAGTTTWATISPVLPMTGTPAITAPFVDTTRVAGVSYQYRCVETNAAGSTPTDPSASFTFVDVTTPGKGTIGVTIITQ
jgi:hypothetical protein